MVFRVFQMVAVLSMVLVWPGASLAANVGLPLVDAAPETVSGSSLDPAEVEDLIQSLEDPTRRARLVSQLRLLATADADAGHEAPGQSVRGAASEAVEVLAHRIGEVTYAAASLADVVRALPGALDEARAGLADPETRSRWLVVAGRLAAVLGAGFVAAWLVRRVVLRPGRTRALPECRSRPIACRLVHRSIRLLIDLLPIVAFAAAAYGVLALVDPRREARYVAVILINASLISRLLMAVATFVFSPHSARHRLWTLSDETAHYLFHWMRRISVIVVYGFAILQAALFLGLGGGAYEMLLRLLGLVVLGLLLVLIAQNRQTVAQAIAGAPAANGDGAGDGDAETGTQLAALRRPIARIWHLIAGLYLVTVYGIWSLRVDQGAWFVLRATLLTVLVAAVAQLLMHMVDQMFRRGLRLSDDVRAGFPGLERRLNRYFPVFASALKLVVGLFALLLIADAWGLDALSWLTEGSGRVLIGASFNIVVIVVVALFVWELAGGAIERRLADTGEGLLPGSTRAHTLLGVARNALTVTLVVVVVLMVMSELGINIAPLLAGAGVVGLAIGFGSQRLVQDVINGAFILFQDLMAVGDVVKLGDKAGVVEALSIRTVRLRDLQGTVHTVPFSAIETVSNLTREFSFHVFDLGIAYREDVDEVVELIKQVGEELRADPVIGPLILDTPEVWGLDQFGDSALVIKGRIKTKPIKQWQVGRAFNGLIKKRFDERGIEIPFPHQTLYFGADKDGTAPPAYVQQMETLRAAEGGLGDR